MKIKQFNLNKFEDDCVLAMGSVQSLQCQFHVNINETLDVEWEKNEKKKLKTKTLTQQHN